MQTISPIKKIKMILLFPHFFFLTFSFFLALRATTSTQHSTADISGLFSEKTKEMGAQTRHTAIFAPYADGIGGLHRSLFI
ncbi:hypothetical protein [Anaerobium acetethylicum]|uniref:hypothetical protein n=1 Tax=Anaerobium acetethylicum TaxID=1619234 RepID=UPI00147098F9|nr:hypothetical protein [Anaerobium acetethylicum]